MTIKTIYEEECRKESDINEHLPTLKKYTEECETVIEMGVRTVVSTWAFLAGKPKKLLSIDLKYPDHYGGDLPRAEQQAEQEGIDFEFMIGDTAQITIPECDLLFIDTWHVYEQLKKELELHADKAQKYIIMHDTTTFAVMGERRPHHCTDTIPGQAGKGILPALNEFLADNPQWKIKEVFQNNNGLTIIERV